MFCRGALTAALAHRLRHCSAKVLALLASNNADATGVPRKTVDDWVWGIFANVQKFRTQPHRCAALGQHPTL